MLHVIQSHGKLDSPTNGRVSFDTGPIRTAAHLLPYLPGKYMHRSVGAPTGPSSLDIQPHIVKNTMLYDCWIIQYNCRLGMKSSLCQLFDTRRNRKSSKIFLYKLQSLTDQDMGLYSVVIVLLFDKFYWNTYLCFTTSWYRQCIFSVAFSKTEYVLTGGFCPTKWTWKAHGPRLG